MNHIKELINIPSDQLRANVQVCLEHSCAIFLGNYEGLGHREELYIRDVMNSEGDENKSDLQFKEILEVFRAKMNSLHAIWHSVGRVKIHTTSNNTIAALLLGIIQAFEMSEVPSIIPPVLEALVTGQWRNFVLSSAGLASPSGMKMKVINEIVTYLLKEDFWEWCKREFPSERGESLNLYINQRVKPLEKLLGEAPET